MNNKAGMSIYVLNCDMCGNPYDSFKPFPKKKVCEGCLTELSQKLYEEDGHAGNLYKQPPEILRKYENKALEIVK